MRNRPVGLMQLLLVGDDGHRFGDAVGCGHHHNLFAVVLDEGTGDALEFYGHGGLLCLLGISKVDSTIVYSAERFVNPSAKQLSTSF